MPVASGSSTARRIFVYGVTGSGKSVAAERIASMTGLPLHLIDDLAWEPGWVEVPETEQRRRIESICAGAEWVLDTAYGKWLDVPRGRTDLIVGLDYPRWLSLSRLVRRTVRRILKKELVCNGNTETLRRALSPQSIIVWHFRSYRRKRERLRRWAEAREGPPVLIFRRPSDLDAWLGRLGEPGGARAPGRSP